MMAVDNLLSLYFLTLRNWGSVSDLSTVICHDNKKCLCLDIVNVFMTVYIYSKCFYMIYDKVNTNFFRSQSQNKVSREGTLYYCICQCTWFVSTVMTLSCVKIQIKQLSWHCQYIANYNIFVVTLYVQSQFAIFVVPLYVQSQFVINHIKARYARQAP